MTSDVEIEQEIKNKGLTAPRVTLDSLKEGISAEYWFTLDKAIHADAPVRPEFGLERFTIYVLVMRNGFIVTGESACASPENFDAELGAKIAKQKAIDKLWALEGYLLKSKIAGLI